MDKLTREELISSWVDLSNINASLVWEERKLKKELEQLKKQHEELKQKIGAEFTELMDDYLENYLDDKGFGGKDLDTILKEHDTMTEEQFTITHGVQLETGKTIKELIALSKDK